MFSQKNNVNLKYKDEHPPAYLRSLTHSNFTLAHFDVALSYPISLALKTFRLIVIYCALKRVSKSFINQHQLGPFQLTRENMYNQVWIVEVSSKVLNS